MIRTLAALLFTLVAAWPAEATEAGWALLRDGGHVILLRHARANAAETGAGGCESERGLNESGRQQARKIGALFAARAAPVAHVLSSSSCRCIETARVAFEEDPEVLSALDPLSPDPAKSAAQIAAVTNTIRDAKGADNVVMVSHLDVINALTGQSPREGEALIVTLDGDNVRVLGRIVFN